MTATRRWIGGILAWLVVAAAGAGPLKPLPDRPPAPDFELRGIDDEIYRLRDYRGRVVVINFWATWCPPCRKEMPSMQRAWERWREHGIELLAVNVGEGEDEVFAFAAEYELEFPVLLDPSGRLVRRWGAVGLPSTFVVDPEGRVVYRATGEREWDSEEIFDLLRALARPTKSQSTVENSPIQARSPWIRTRDQD
jgi:peroxiredoxin